MMKRHPRRVTGVVSAVLAGSAFTAFGVAPIDALEASAPQPTITTVVESLPLPQLLPQLEALDRGSLPLYRSDLTRSADTADILLKRLGVDDAEAARFLRSDPVASQILSGRIGKMVKAVADNGRLMEMVVRGPAELSSQLDTHFTRVVITRQPGSDVFTARAEQAPLQVAEQVASGTITSSLFAAADAAGVPDAVTNQLAEIFGTDIDFRRELRKGDAFSVVYQGLTADGELITWGGATGRVLAARFINKGEVHNAIWFAEAGRKGAFYDLNGRSKNKAFLASPLAFSRVTSGFAMRFHPIQKRWKAHLGVDYGAPTGTTVRAIGDGVVTFAGWQNGYGNVVQVTHSGHRTTMYAHLSKIGVRKGQSVEQGHNLGAVGSTGWATGPHLHFEFKVKGQHKDPMIIARASESTQLSPQARTQYRQVAQTAAQRLDVAGDLQTAGIRTGARFE